MTVAQHTPGPWFVVKRHTRSLARAITTSPDNARGDIANVIYGLGSKNVEADAALFAAAPDLLEALRRTTEMCESYADWIKRNVMSANIEEHPYLPELEGAAEDARAAIAKTEVHHA